MSAPARVALALLVLAGCGGAQKQEAQTARATERARDDQAVRLFVEGAEQLARGTPKSIARARELLTQALTLAPTLWEAHYDLGLAYRKLGELDQAERELARARELAPEADEPLWALAECALARGEPDRAAPLLEQLLAHAPERAEAREPARERNDAQAREPTRERNDAQARESTRERNDAQARAHARERDDVEVRLTLAAVERERDRLDEALKLARAVLVNNPKEIRALLEIGRIYRAQSAYDVSELVLEKARALADKSAPVYNELGLLALARGDTQLAFTHFSKAESLDPSFWPAHVNQGSVLLRAGDYAAAERAYRAALPAGADTTLPTATALEARVGLGIALRGQGKYKEARATYEKVLETHPSHPAALYDLGVLLADFLDQRKQAIPFFERYLASASKSDSHRASAERYLQDIRMSTGSTQ